MLQKGDSVIMHDCGEAEHYQGIIWTCETDEWQMPSNRSVVKLKGFSGAFAVDCLIKVNPTDDETVICEGCDKEILADSKGYEVYMESEGAYCLQCEKAKSEHLQAEAFVHNAMNEFAQTHLVFKMQDLEGANIGTVMNQVGIDVSEYRISKGKKAFPSYIVINTDENPQMIREVIEVMKKFDKWG